MLDAAMELYQNGYIKEEECEGDPLTWGSSEAIIERLFNKEAGIARKMIVFPKGCWKNLFRMGRLRGW